jgi:hypothetical protein
MRETEAVNDLAKKHALTDTMTGFYSRKSLPCDHFTYDHLDVPDLRLAL